VVALDCPKEVIWGNCVMLDLPRKPPPVLPQKKKKEKKEKKERKKQGT
jgi:hypothetical protein